MPASVERKAHAKINLLLNVLGRRPDGFHELETVLYQIGLFDKLRITKLEHGVRFFCNDNVLADDSTNLVTRAASAFFKAAQIVGGASIELEKRIPIAAGLGGGSSDAAATLLGLNELFDHPLAPGKLARLAVELGSDVRFFLQPNPALATGRGEQIQSLPTFTSLASKWLLLVYPGFGVSTAWAYRRLAQFPQALNGTPGRAQKLVHLLQTTNLPTAAAEFYNALEAPVLHKYPILAIYQEFLRANGAVATMMSGSGSTTFAIFDDHHTAEHVQTLFKQKFGRACWTAILQL